jgi:hypothetical protein
MIASRDRAWRRLEVVDQADGPDVVVEAGGAVVVVDHAAVNGADVVVVARGRRAVAGRAGVVGEGVGAHVRLEPVAQADVAEANGVSVDVTAWMRRGERWRGG